MNSARFFLALALVCLAVLARAAGPGDIDPTFATRGMYQPLPECCGNAGGAAMAVQSDGKILVGGWGQNGSTQTQDAVIARLNTDGSLDATFATAGIARVNIPGFRAEIRQLLVQPDGAIVAMGYRAPANGVRQGLVVRLDSTGRIDTSFGNGGMTAIPSTAISGAVQLRRAMLQPDGKIVVVGTMTFNSTGTDTDMFVARLTAVGAMDASFGSNGLTLSGMVDRDDGYDVALLGNGSMLVVGIAVVAGTSYGALMRVLPNGQLDPSFDNDGIKAPVVGFPLLALSMVVQSDGRILIGGRLNNANAAVLRLMPDGSLDTSYGNGGAATFSTLQQVTRLLPLAGDAVFALGESFSTILVQKINAAGAVDPTWTVPTGTFSSSSNDVRIGELALSGSALLLTRAASGTSIDTSKFLATGALDTAFGTGGTAKVSPGLALPTGDLFSLAVTSNGSIVYPRPSQSLNTTIITRLAPDGREDTTFGTAGRVTVSGAIPGAIAAKADDKILVSDTSGRIRQFLPDGTVDPQFTVPVLGSGSVPFIVPMADGRFLFGSSSRIARYTATGALDSTFNFGQVLVSPGPSWSAAALNTSNGFYIGGSRFIDRTVGTVERRLDTGELDFTFGSNGRVDFAISSQTTTVVKIITQPDGKLLVGGTGIAPSQGTLAPNTIYVMRILPTGFFDANFAGGTGIARLPSFGTLPTARGMALQPDGKILITGTEGSPSTTFRGWIWRLNSDGTPDTTFGQGGLAYIDTTPSSEASNAIALQPGGGIIVGGSATGTYAIWRVFSAATGAGSPPASLVSSYYRTILGRDPDVAGQAFWEGEISRMTSLGASASEAFYLMAGSFFGSAEYLQKNTGNRQFVTDLYRTFFAREPDVAGSDFWVNQLATGRPRDAVLNEFLFSAEFANFMTSLFGAANTSPPEVSMVMDFFRGLLHRLPDSAGFSFWVGRLRTAQCNMTVTTEADLISSQFLSSQEYANRMAAQPNASARNAAFVLDLYSAFLRRGADRDGYVFFTGQLDSGAQTREQVRSFFVGSQEFQARVQAVQARGCTQ